MDTFLGIIFFVDDIESNNISSFIQIPISIDLNLRVYVISFHIFVCSFNAIEKLLRVHFLLVVNKVVPDNIRQQLEW